jgi:hypothetical protein
MIAAAQSGTPSFENYVEQVVSSRLDSLIFQVRQI